jgi:uncharacterized cupin superfamily protein
MTDPNVFSDEWQHELGGARGTLVGAAAGARQLGATVVELPPGGQVAPYHMHHGNEELLIVLQGTPELRTPTGTRRLAEGAVVAFVAGPEGAHRLRNTSDAPCRYVMVSTQRFPDIAEHVDTGTTLAITEPGGGRAFPSGSEGDAMELVQAAVAAERR